MIDRFAGEVHLRSVAEVPVSSTERVAIARSSRRASCARRRRRASDDDVLAQAACSRAPARSGITNDSRQLHDGKSLGRRLNKDSQHRARQAAQGLDDRVNKSLMALEDEARACAGRGGPPPPVPARARAASAAGLGGGVDVAAARSSARARSGEDLEVVERRRPGAAPDEEGDDVGGPRMWRRLPPVSRQELPGKEKAAAGAVGREELEKPRERAPREGESWVAPSSHSPTHPPSQRGASPRPRRGPRRAAMPSGCSLLWTLTGARESSTMETTATWPFFSDDEKKRIHKLADHGPPRLAVAAREDLGAAFSVVQSAVHSKEKIKYAVKVSRTGPRWWTRRAASRRPRRGPPGRLRKLDHPRAVSLKELE